MYFTYYKYNKKNNSSAIAETATQCCICHLLLVNNAKMFAILHRFQVIAHWWNFRFRAGSLSLFNAYFLSSRQWATSSQWVTKGPVFFLIDTPSSVLCRNNKYTETTTISALKSLALVIVQCRWVVISTCMFTTTGGFRTEQMQT